MPSGQFDFEAEVRQSSYAAAGEGVGGHLRLNRRGELVIDNFITQASIDGRLFCASAGSISTPITWTATAAVDYTKYALMGTVPSGTTIIPVEIQLYMEAYGTNAIFECGAAVGYGGAAAGDTAVTPTCMRSDAPNTSRVTWGSDGTGATAIATNFTEFWRDGLQSAITKATAVANIANADTFRYVWRLADSMYTPVVVGPGQIQVAQGSQAGTGFCKVIYIEMPTTSVI